MITTQKTTTKFQVIWTKFIFWHIDPTFVWMRYPWHEFFLFRFRPSSNLRLAPDLTTFRCVESFKSICWVWRELSRHRTDRRTERVRKPWIGLKRTKVKKNGQKWTKGKSIIIFLWEFENTAVFQPTNKLLNVLLI